MNFTNWLENTAIAIAVNEGISTYPTVIALHSVGLGLLIGALFIINIRVLGGFQRLPFAALEKLMLIAAFGFIVNALSGVFLYVAQATTFTFESPLFLVKIAFVFIGAIIALIFRTKYLDDVSGWEASGVAVAGAKKLAFVSLLVWSGAIIAGRLMAYIPGEGGF